MVIRSRLFRREALDARKNRLEGNVLLATPLSWQAVAYLLTAFVGIIAIYLFKAPFQRVETVQGLIVPTEGLVTVYPAKAGTIEILNVREGDLVKEGAQIAILRSDEATNAGKPAGVLLELAAGRQQELIQAQIGAGATETTARYAEINSEISTLKSEISLANEQLALQQQLVSSAEEDLAMVGPIAERGFVSRNEMRARQEQVVSRRQSLLQTRQLLRQMSGRLTQLSEQKRQSEAQLLAKTAALTGQIEDLHKEVVSGNALRSQVIVAPISGRVTAITGQRGQFVDAQTQLLHIVPENSSISAELEIPSSSRAFVKLGQKVNLAVDSFPYATFGTISGEIEQLAVGPIVKAGPTGAQYVYPARVKLAKTAIYAFGRSEPVLPGMGVSARILANKQSMLEWLFEPLLAVQKR